MLSIKKTNIIPVTTFILSALIGIVGIANFNTSHNTKPAVIFDMDGVLFKTSKMGAFKKLGTMSIISYAIGGNSPTELHTIAFDILFKLRNEKPEDFNNKFWPTYNGKPLPSIMCDWQQGTIKPDAVLKQVLPYVEKLAGENYFSSDKEKQLIVNMFDIMFNPETRSTITKPLSEGIRILEECKKAGYRVYVLSNMDTESMELLQSNYPEIFNQLDGMVYSADVKNIKPYNQIYFNLIQKYGLPVDNCIFLDNQQENVDAAEKLGIKSMLCTKDSMKTLAKLMHKNTDEITPKQLIAQAA